MTSTTKKFDLSECDAGDEACLAPLLKTYDDAAQSLAELITPITTSDIPACKIGFLTVAEKLAKARAAVAQGGATLGSDQAETMSHDDLQTVTNDMSPSQQELVDAHQEHAASCETAIEQAAETGDAPEAEEPVDEMPLTVDVPSSVRSSTVKVTGETAPGSKVKVGKKSAKVAKDGSFTATVALKRGENEIEVSASNDALGTTVDTVQVTRNRTQAEIQRAIAARKARERAREEARKARVAQRVANWKASTTTIPYNHLNKDASRYEGKRVKYTGKILQIQEGASGGMMLLSVTNEGWDIWTDNIWVNFDRRIKSAEDDKITVYGTVDGERSYDTQIGGTTYVPEITARYIEE